MPAELIFLLVFLGLSLLGGLTGNKRPPGNRPVRLPDGRIRFPDGRILGPEGITWEQPPAPVASAPAPLPGSGPRTGRRRLPAPASSREESSSEGGGGSQETVEVIPDFEAVSLEPLGTALWESTAVAPRPEPARAVLEQPEVDWEAEHERFHRRYVDRPSAADARGRRGVLGTLRGRGGLRAAILAAEVLGPPRALRPPDER